MTTQTDNFLVNQDFPTLSQSKTPLDQWHNDIVELNLDNLPPPHDLTIDNTNINQTSEQQNLKTTDSYQYTPNDIEQLSDISEKHKASHITRTEIEHAVHLLIARGESISINKIRAAVGHGSYSTISRVLKDLGLGSERLLKNNTPNKNLSLDEQNLLASLEDECAKLRAKTENLDQLIHKIEQENIELISRIIDQEVVKDIILRHLKDESILKELLQNCGLIKAVPSCHQHILNLEVKKLKIEALDFLISTLTQELNSGASSYAGGPQSVLALLAMLKNEKDNNRIEQSEQAYHF